MATLGSLNAEIAADIVQDDLSTQIDNAIIAAIRELQTEKTSFNSDISLSLSTSTGSAELALPTGFFSMTKLQLSMGGVLETIDEVSQERIMHYRYQSRTDRPSKYAIFDSLIQFDVLASDDYNATISYYRTYDLPVSASDTHTWLDNAYSLVKYKAKSILFANSLFDWDNAAGFKALADEELRRIKNVFNTESSSSLTLALN